MLGRTRRIHFVGIGGSGMSAIAELLAGQGYDVSGSDLTSSETTDRLAAQGVLVREGHAAGHVGAADVVVVSSAVRPSNPEVAEAQRRGIPVVPRAEMLAVLMRARFSIAVTGAHGKTTTAAMVAAVLERGGLDPDVLVGGRVKAFGSGARRGRGEFLVAEADESDRSFLMLWPSVAVMTNIDREHLESYGSFAALQQAFAEFADRVPFYGAVVACADDPNLAPVIAGVRHRAITYGLEGGAGLAAGEHLAGTGVEVGTFGARCSVHRRTATGVDRLGTLTLQVPGRHNLQNALAAVAVAQEVGIPFEAAAAALAVFEGTERRFDRRGEADGVLVVDDYAHHPTEIAAVLEAARATLGRRLVVAFQPHRYTRTGSLIDAFGPAFRHADQILLTDVYAAGEDPIPGVTVEALAEAMRRGSGRPVRIVALDRLAGELAAVAKPGDAVITLGAGSIGGAVPQILEALRRREGSG